MPVNYSDDPTGVPGSQGYGTVGWSSDDSANLKRSTAALGGINLLLLILTLISAAGLILGIIGYIKIVDRLDDISHNTEVAADAVTPAPGPTVSPSPSATATP